MVEKEVEVPVEVIVEKEVEVPVEVVVEKEVIREVEVPVEVPVEVIVEREVVREVEVPVEVIKEVIVEKEVIREVVVEVPVVEPPEPSVPQVVRLVGLVPSPGSVILDDVGDTGTLSVQGYYSDQTTADVEASLITYESTDSDVVSVTSDGLVTANGPGGADIIVAFGDFSERVHAAVIGEIPTLPPYRPGYGWSHPRSGRRGSPGCTQPRDRRVGTRFGTSVAEEIAMALDGQVVFSYRTFPGYIIEFDAQTRDLSAAITQLSGDGRVAEVYPDTILEAADHPIDALTVDANSLYMSPNFETAWRIVEKIPSAALAPVNIAMIDDGMIAPGSVNDPETAALLSSEFDWDRIHQVSIGPEISDIPVYLLDLIFREISHATAVASVMTAQNNQGSDSLSGIVTSAGGIDYQLFDYAVTSVSGVASAFEHINANNTDVVNISRGKRCFLGKIDCSERSYYQMANLAHDVLVVAAVGNDDTDASKYFPVKWTIAGPENLPSLHNLVGVGALDSEGEGRASFSNYGNAVTIAAPGDFVRVLGLDWEYQSGGDHVLTGASIPFKPIPVPRWEWKGQRSFYRGTSLSSPLVAGTAALLLAISPELTPEQVKGHLLDTSDLKKVCTSDQDPCPQGAMEDWHALRADKAVAKLISDRVDAEIVGVGSVPSETQRVVGSDYEFDVGIEQHGKILWDFYVEAFVTPPDGDDANRVSLDPVEVSLDPQATHRVRFGFSPDRAGCWDLSVKVWMEDPDPGRHQAQSLPTPLRVALAELNPPVDIKLDEKEWPDVLEVRSDPNTPEQCASATSTTELPTGLRGEVANVLLLADTSGSMEGLKDAALKEAITFFANRMYEIRVQAKGGIDPDPDHVGLTEFYGGYREVVPIGPVGPAGTSLDDWGDAVDSLYADGGTVLYDAIIRSVDVLESLNIPDRKNVLIVLTDGVDESSGYSLGDAVAKLGESSVTLFALGLSEPGGSDHYDFSVLQALANAGRGTAYAADTEDLTGLYDLFATIFEIEAKGD